MTTDVSDIKAFYLKPQGALTRRLIFEALRPFVEARAGLNVLGLGYATPYLGLYRDNKMNSFSFMPAQIGAKPWPTARPSRTCLVEEANLPLLDGAMDVILLVHALENANNPQELMHELWRVLAPNGKLILVVPNRLSPWARDESTPFSHGRPFSAHQLTSLLTKNAFTPLRLHHALRMPPVEKNSLLRIAKNIESFGQAMHLPLGGVLIAHAMKEVHRPIALKKSRILLPSLNPSFQTSRETTL